MSTVREWIDAGVFDQLKAEALAAYDRMIGFDLDNVSLGVFHQAILEIQRFQKAHTHAKMDWKHAVHPPRVLGCRLVDELGSIRHRHRRCTDL